MEIGQRIELYKIHSTGGYGSNSFVPGTIRPANMPVMMGSSNTGLVMLTDNTGLSLPMFMPSEASPVGAMIIKKLKV